MGKPTVTSVLESEGGLRYSVRVLVLVGTAMVIDGFDFMIVSFTMPQIMSEIQLGLIATESLSSFSIIGMLVGGLFSGYLADRFGRKNVLNLSIAIYSILTVPVFFCSQLRRICAMSYFSGVSVGAVIPLSVVFVSEYAPTSHRGLFVTLTKMFMTFGWVLAGLVAMAVVSRLDWRFCYLICDFPFLYAVFMHFCIHESVHWLVRKGRREEAAQILNEMNARLDIPRE